ncbi:DUF2157 domain-containing protein [Solitalea lacus]|uniref:DUF2157 domain-containing protein n=1 Tax=Solitalea lacus TaxID=2911172 RepID=UPI001EDBB3BE|nr:DUF2157 domain-containing protein [Solitalea lacus]UKJ06480.1 DUF2157 domain-containing protein [Solitalea lacus]
MNNKLAETLHAEELLSTESLNKIKAQNSNPLFSVHWELRSLLYIGVVLLSSGLSITVYKNIDTIGHQLILLFIALIFILGFGYCLKKKTPFTFEKTTSPGSFFDYILLLSCLTFVTFVGYLQYVYTLFGTHYGMATFIPMVVLFSAAYYFDHLGVLSLAITNLALWMGLSITPTRFLEENDFDNERIIYTALILGVILLLGASFSEKFNIKKHFKFTYQNFGLHITFVALLATYFFYYLSGYYETVPSFYRSIAIVWLLLLGIIAYFYYLDSIKDKSFYFLLIITLYSYVAISCIAVRILSTSHDMGAVYLILMYFIGSAVGVVLFLINLNKKLKSA